MKSVTAWLREKAARYGLENPEEANIGAVIGFLLLAITMSIGVVILYSVEQAVPIADNSSGWYSTQTALATTTQSGYGLLAITLIDGRQYNNDDVEHSHGSRLDPWRVVHARPWIWQRLTTSAWWGFTPSITPPSPPVKAHPLHGTGFSSPFLLIGKITCLND